MGRGVKGKGREKGGRGGKREGPPLQSTPPVKKSWIRACLYLKCYDVVVLVRAFL